MPIRDVAGQTSGHVVGELDITHRRFEPVAQDLLPRGRAWDREDPVLMKLVAAETTELSRVDVRARKLQRELDPSTTFELLTEWETSLGLPDCAAPATLAARRGAVLAKLLAQAGHKQDLSYWADLLAQLGYELHFVEKGPEGMTCVGDCMDVPVDESAIFVWWLMVDDGLDDALLECVVTNNSLMGSYPIVHFLWQLVETGVANELYAVACTGQGYIVAAGENGRRLYTGIDLTTWAQAAYAPSDVFAVCALGEVLLAVGMPLVQVRRSYDGGATWALITINGPELYGLSRGPDDDQVAVAVGKDGALWRTANAGTGWTQLGAVVATDLYAITRCEGAMVAVGRAGVVLRGTNNGLSWSEIAAAGPTKNLRGVSAWELVVIAVGEDGEIWRSTDAGLTWAQRPSPTTATLRAVTSSPSGRWAACGLGGVIVMSLDDGLTWELQDSPTTEDLFGACAYLPAGRFVLVGDTGNVILE